MLVKCGHAELDEIAGVQIVVGRVLEQFAPGLLDDEVVIGRGADVLPLTRVADPGILPRVTLADVGSAVG